MAADLRLISSMATRPLLTELAAAWQAAHADEPLTVESVGSVDAARRVQAGEAFDGVVLAANAIDALIDACRVRPGSRVDLVRSGVSVAVRSGAALPDIGSEDALRAAVLAAPSLGYSTGPSGVAWVKLVERWGIAAQLGDRHRQAPPGVPVARLVAEGAVALGFQQTSELLGQDGVRIVGPLPAAVQITTTFSAGVCAAAARPDAVCALLQHWAAAEHDELKRRHGMEPAR